MIKRLVVVRAGPNTLHRAWHPTEGEADFHIAVSYYGDGEYQPQRDEFVHYYKGGKWEGIYDLFKQNPNFLTEYSHIWLPDDDLATNAEDISKLFDIAERHGLDVCQPSLTWDSYFSHFITLNNKRFLLRYSNLVEVMAPLLTAETLKSMLPLFDGLRFGWGLDYIWTRIMDNPFQRSAIVDAVAVSHLRAISTGSLYSQTSKSPPEERRHLLDRAGLASGCTAPLVYGGIDVNGEHLTRGLGLWHNLYSGWSGLRHYPGSQWKRKPTRRQLIKSTWKYASGKVNLAPLSKQPTPALDHPVATA